MSNTTTIGLSRKQRVYATLESVLGTLKFPNGTTDYIRPVGNVTINQKPTYQNSEELRNTLDVLDQFQNAVPPGDFTITMYIRPSGTLATTSPPQGGTLFRCLAGSVQSATTASLSAAVASVTIATATLKAISGEFPHTGVITVGSEKMAYTGFIHASGSATGTLIGITRGYAGTSATTHLIDVLGTLTSLFYKQKVTSPSFSLWVESDHFVQSLAGCSINSATLEFTNEGGLSMTFTGQGVQMRWAGTDALASNATAGDTTIYVSDAKRFCAQMYLYNSTKNSAGKLINSTNATTNAIVLSTPCGAAWATSDVIAGYVPADTVIGDAIEAKDSLVYLDSVSSTIKKCTLNIGTPKKYLNDEVGTQYPTDFLEDVRDINSNLSLYFRRADAKYFKEGYDGNEIPIRVVFGDTAGYIMELYFLRSKLQVPEISFVPPAVELTMLMSALGTLGEDSMEIVFK